MPATFISIPLSSKPCLFRPSSTRHYTRVICHCSTSPPRATSTMRPIGGLSAIIHHYDTLLLDQFGVIHDGQKLYADALTALQSAHSRGIKVIIVSNSSRESSHALSKLAALGIPSEYIHAVITSGELALTKISEYTRQNPRHRALHFNWKARSGDINLPKHGITGLCEFRKDESGRLYPDMGSFDFILAHGTEGFTTALAPGRENVHAVPLEDMLELCRKIARQRPEVPFFCANPDVVTVDGDLLKVMPGALAAAFEEEGGKVVRLGKPDRVTYEAAAEIVSGKALAVGDSVAHDVLGAVNAGMDCLYIAGGIHAKRFGIVNDNNNSSGDSNRSSNSSSSNSNSINGGQFSWPEDWEAIFSEIVSEECAELARSQQRPNFVCDKFRW